MGDWFDRRHKSRHARGKPPPTLLAWGLGTPAEIGHNNGPPLEDEQPGYLWRRYRWAKVHAAAWKPPSMGVLKFRAARAEAAGLSYHDYTKQLLDTGRFAQARDRDAPRREALAKVRTAWRRALPRLAPDALPMAGAIVLASLTAAYSEDQRAYHNAFHIAAVLGDLTRYMADTHDRDALIMAALFHDAIYDATRSDNEVASARVAGVHLRELGVPAPRITKICSMIEATRHRVEDVTGADADTALLLDCDLAILAAPRDRYMTYAQAVRREYAHVPDQAFREGRARILSAFLARARLYATSDGAARWDAVARGNIGAELDQLRHDLNAPIRPSA